MTNEQKAVIRRLRQQNNSYVSIANTLGVSVSAVKGYCQRNGLTGLRAAAESTPDDPSVCLGTGAGSTAPTSATSPTGSREVRHDGTGAV